MTYIHENEVNKISKCNLLHDIVFLLKALKLIYILISYYTCMYNTQNVRVKFNKF